jgi:preprotein translocase subunit SecB
LKAQTKEEALNIPHLEIQDRSPEISIAVARVDRDTRGRVFKVCLPPVQSSSRCKTREETAFNCQLREYDMRRYSQGLTKHHLTRHPDRDRELSLSLD